MQSERSLSQTLSTIIVTALVVSSLSIAGIAFESTTTSAATSSPQWATQDGAYPTFTTIKNKSSEPYSSPQSTAPSNLSNVLSNMAGSGTSSDPYVITNSHELQAIKADLSAHYVLGNNIDASGTSNWNGGSGFDAIGTNPFGGTGFSGTFDGQGYTIKGLYVQESEYAGLFAFTDGATIRNVRIKGATIKATSGEGGALANAMYNGGTAEYIVVTDTTVNVANRGGIVTGNSWITVENVIVKNSKLTSSGSGPVAEMAMKGGARYAVAVNNTLDAPSASKGSMLGGTSSNSPDIIESSYHDDQWNGPVATSSMPVNLNRSEMQGTAAIDNMPDLDWKIPDSMTSDSTADMTVTVSESPSVKNITISANNKTLTDGSSSVSVPSTTHTVEMQVSNPNRTLDELDQVRLQLYRSDVGNASSTPSINPDNRHYLEVTFDGTNATDLSVDSTNTNVQTTIVSNVNGSLSEDTLVFEIQMPNSAAPSANTGVSTVNNHNWIATGTLQTSTLDGTSAATTKTFEVGTLVDIRLNADALTIGQENAAVPGSSNVAFQPMRNGAPAGTTGVKIENTGNVEVDVKARMTKLTMTKDGKTYAINASQTKFMAGQSPSVNDYSQSGVKRGSTNRIELTTASGTKETVQYDETTQVVTWIDIPQDKPPGQYTGTVTYSVSQVSAA